MRRGIALRVAVADAGAGPDPRTLYVTIDGSERTAVLRGGVVRIGTGTLAPGRHRLRLQISDYQESRNMENVARDPPEHARADGHIHRPTNVRSRGPAAVADAFRALRVAVRASGFATR